MLFRGMKTYSSILSAESYDRAERYLRDLASASVKAGNFLSDALEHVDMSQCSVPDFLERLINTKKPQIFAESRIHGDGQDWTQVELSLLGDLSIAIPVTVFDDGAHTGPHIHEVPFDATLIFTPGALLRNDLGGTPVDWDEVHTGEVLDPSGYAALYRRRLLPALKWIDSRASLSSHKALITLPGLGCGQFAGRYQGHLGEMLKGSIAKILETEASNLSNIRAIWYDPYAECVPDRQEFGNTVFITRPLLHDLFPRPQLSTPSDFGFADCDLYSFVAWDHVSWPGNDYFVGGRVTDDGVKAAATDSMRALTGVKGHYSAEQSKYLPPADFSTWRAVVKQKQVTLDIVNTLLVA